MEAELIFGLWEYATGMKWPEMTREVAYAEGEKLGQLWDRMHQWTEAYGSDELAGRYKSLDDEANSYQGSR